MGRSNDELDDLFEDLDPEDKTVKKLRDLVEKRGKRIAELEDENGKLSTSNRSRTVTDVLKSKGVNEKVAQFIPSTVDATPEAVEAWLTENADVFGVKSPATPAATEPGDEGSGSEVDPAVAQALQSIDATVAGAVTPGKEADLMARLADPNLTLDQLNALMVQNGGIPSS